ncbi:hypothetical protein [uncultured Mediterranean phage uvMED]|nr:hypothetical protein [uncultured Mediterranean phage uvMED]
MKQWYPTLGATTAGATAGAFGGGPLAIGLASGGGALAGEVAKGNAEMEEARETISALTRGDVQALVEKGMQKQASGFESFTTTIKRILIFAFVGLLCYLAIPIFVARRCSRSEVKKGLTNPPFPIRPSDKP